MLHISPLQRRTLFVVALSCCVCAYFLALPAVVSVYPFVTKYPAPHLPGHCEFSILDLCWKYFAKNKCAHTHIAQRVYKLVKVYETYTHLSCLLPPSQLAFSFFVISSLYLLSCGKAQSRVPCEQSSKQWRLMLFVLVNAALPFHHFACAFPYVFLLCSSSSSFLCALCISMSREQQSNRAKTAAERNYRTHCHLPKLVPKKSG